MDSQQTILKKQILSHFPNPATQARKWQSITTGEGGKNATLSQDQQTIFNFPIVQLGSACPIKLLPTKLWVQLRSTYANRRDRFGPEESGHPIWPIFLLWMDIGGSHIYNITYLLQNTINGNLPMNSITPRLLGWLGTRTSHLQKTKTMSINNPLGKVRCNSATVQCHPLKRYEKWSKCDYEVIIWTMTKKRKEFECRNATDCDIGPYHLLCLIAACRGEGSRAPQQSSVAALTRISPVVKVFIPFSHIMD